MERNRSRNDASDGEVEQVEAVDGADHAGAGAGAAAVVGQPEGSAEEPDPFLPAEREWFPL